MEGDLPRKNATPNSRISEKKKNLISTTQGSGAEPKRNRKKSFEGKNRMEGKESPRRIDLNGSEMGCYMEEGD